MVIHLFVFIEFNSEIAFRKKVSVFYRFSVYVALYEYCVSVGPYNSFVYWHVWNVFHSLTKANVITIPVRKINPVLCNISNKWKKCPIGSNNPEDLYIYFMVRLLSKFLSVCTLNRKSCSTKGNLLELGNMPIIENYLCNIRL